MNYEKIIKPIAFIHTDFKEKFGIPRQSGCAPSLKGKVVFLPEFRNDDSLKGLEGYSHIWILFGFSEANKNKQKECGWSPTVRPPRLGGNTRLGVFASRSPYRPNSIGLSSVKLDKIENTEEGSVLFVSGVDLLDNTPIYDIKPYLPYTDCHNDAIGGFAEEVFDYSLKVSIPDELLSKLPCDKISAVKECLAQDIRPAYQNDSARIYSMKFSEFDIKFKVSDKTVRVVEIIKEN